MEASPSLSPALVENAPEPLPVHVAVLDRTGAIVSVNKAWRESGGKAGFAGQNAEIGDDYLEVCAAGGAGQEWTGPLVQGLRALLRDRGPGFTFEYGAESRDGRRYFQCTGVPMEQDGAVVMHIDITARRALENALQAALDEKVMLLREVNHRVKNSLQMVSNLLTLQSMTLQDEGVRHQFRDARSRIHAIAQVHQRLYQTDTFRSIEFGEFLRDLCKSLSETAGGPETIDIAVDADDMELPIDKAAPLGLVANEFITNAIKHRAGDRAKVSVSLKRRGHGCELVVADHGPGLPDGFDPKRSRSLGMMLITNLVQQIGGRLEVDPVPRGACFRVVLDGSAEGSAALG